MLLQVVARAEPPVLHSLCSKLEFGAVRPGESLCLELKLPHKGGEGVIRPLIASRKEIQEWLLCPPTSAIADAAGYVVPDATIAASLHRQPRQQQDKNAFSVCADTVLLQKNGKSASLTVQFAPKEAGAYAAWLLLIPAYLGNVQTSTQMHPVDGERPQPLGMVELRGIADSAMLTLNEFCGTKWPADLVAKALPACLAAEIEAQFTTAADEPQLHAPVGAVGESSALKVVTTDVSLQRIIKSILPQDMDFGITTPQNSKLLRTVKLCNEGLLPIHVVWRPTIAKTKSPVQEMMLVPRASEDMRDSSELEGFSVEPIESVIPPKGSCSFSFSVDPRLLPSRALQLEGGVSGSCFSHCSGFSLFMLNVPKEALLDPHNIFTISRSSYLTPASTNEGQQVQKDKSKDLRGLPRWAPLFADTIDGETLAFGDTRCTAGGSTEWEMHRLALRVILEQPQVVVLGSCPSGKPFLVAPFSPGVSQEMHIWVKNKGRADVGVCVPPNLSALEVRWRRLHAANSSARSHSISEHPFNMEDSMAWLIRVEEGQIDELQCQKDPVFGLGPTPFGYFSVSPQRGLPLPSGVCAVVVLRVLPFCCGFFSIEVPVATSAMNPQRNTGTHDEAEPSLRIPLSCEVLPPRVSTCWPPHVDFGTVRAHSRTTRAVLLYNNSNLPTVARIRISTHIGSNVTEEARADVATGDGNAATKSDSCTSAAFPCHFCSCLLRAASQGTDSTTASDPSNASCNCEAAEGDVASGPSPEADTLSASSAPRCCTKCLCIDDSMRYDEPFLQDAKRAAEAAARSAAAAEIRYCTRFVDSDDAAAVQQQQDLLDHLAQWPYHCQAQGHHQQTHSSAVFALSGLLVVYPSYVYLPAGGRGAFLFTLRASHPQDIDIVTLVETLEGIAPLALSLKGKVSLPRLRLNTQQLQLPPLYVLHTRAVQHQLTLHNESDLPVKIMWKTTANQLKETQQERLTYGHGQQPELGDQAEVAQCASMHEHDDLLISLSPSECILEGLSSISVDISCVGLTASPHLKARAFCVGGGMLLPLQVSCAAACSGVSVTYVFLTQQELLAAAALLTKSREQVQCNMTLSNKKAVGDNLSCNSSSRDGQCQRGRSTKRGGNVSSKDDSRNCARGQKDALDHSEEVIAALQATGIGRWGILQEMPSEFPQQVEKEVELEEIDAGGEASFLYVLVINSCPIQARVALEAFTHSTQQLHRQLCGQNERHPLLPEEGRPVGAFACADCSSAAGGVEGNVKEKDFSSLLMSYCVKSERLQKRGCAKQPAAEALILQAAAGQASPDLHQLRRRPFSEPWPSFKAATGVHAVQAAAGRTRRRQLLSRAPEGLVMIPHPECTSNLAQDQTALLALEIFAALPGDFHAGVRLRLERVIAQQRQPSQARQIQEVVLPIKIHVRGKALVLPPMQKHVSFRPSLPPLLTAHLTLQNPMTTEEPCSGIQQRQERRLQPTCYRRNERLLPLKSDSEGIVQDLRGATQAGAGPHAESRQCPQPQYNEQRVCFKVQNNSSNFLLVKWLLFDLGMWEMQQQIEEQLQRVIALKDAAFKALRHRALSTAKYAAAAAKEAEAAAANAAAMSTTPTPAPRIVVRPLAVKAPDPAVVAAEGAAVAAALAEEAAFEATEAAAAAAATGMREALDGWTAVAKSATPASAQYLQQTREEEQKRHCDAEGVFSESGKATDSMLAGAVSETSAAEEARANAEKLFTWCANASAATSAEPARIAEPALAQSSNNVARWIPPRHCLISANSPIALEERGVAAAAEVLRCYKGSTSAAMETAVSPQVSARQCNFKTPLAAATGDQGGDDHVLVRGPREPSATASKASQPSATELTDTCLSSAAPHMCSFTGPLVSRETSCCHLFPSPIPEGARQLFGEKAQLLGTPKGHVAPTPPHVEPNVATLAPHESLDVSLFFGSLQAAEGIHRLRAVALCELVPPDGATGSLTSVAHAKSSHLCTLWNESPITLEASLPRLLKGQQVRGACAMAACSRGVCPQEIVDCHKSKDDLSLSQPMCKVRQAAHAPFMSNCDTEDVTFKLGAAAMLMKAPQPVRFEPLIVDFMLETNRPSLKVKSINDSCKLSAAKKATATVAAKQHLGTIRFIGLQGASEANSEDEHTPSAAVTREVVLQPSFCHAPISFYLSVTGQAFKLCKAQKEQRHQQQHSQEQPLSEKAHRQTLSSSSNSSMLITLDPLQQLRLLVGFTALTDKAAAEDGTECYGQIQASFPLAETPCGNGKIVKDALLGYALQQQLEHEQMEELLTLTMISGILKMLNFMGDSKALLAVGVSAMQQSKNAGHDQLVDRYQRQLQHEELLLKKMGSAWLLSTKAAVAAIEMEQSGRCDSVDLNGLPDSKRSVLDSPCKKNFTQILSLVGLRRQARLLLFTPPEELPLQKQQQIQSQVAASGWASYTDPKVPLVIDFNTSCVSPRMRLCRVLKLRAVSALSMGWRISNCRSTGSTSSSNTEILCNLLNQHVRKKLTYLFSFNSLRNLAHCLFSVAVLVLQKRATSENACAFGLSCLEGTLGSHRDVDGNKLEATILIRFT
ncbi:hypothetical protein Efla_003165 [Eimeria flavescens]